MNILFIAAEVAPFVSVGGLSQVMYFLPQALRRQGHDVRIFTAKYGTMDGTASYGKSWKLALEYEQLKVPLAHDSQTKRHIICNVKSFQKSKNIPQTYFLENREYFELRANVFGYKDDHVRFALLSKGCLEWLYTKKQEKDNSKKVWWPDIIHCHDWHTSYFIDLVKKNHRYQSLFSHIPVVLTVHNFSYQGNYDFRYTSKKDYDIGQTPLEPLDSEKLITQNALKRGLLYADAVNTVSPTHAVEVLTPEYAAGLEDVLHSIRDKLTGILNGLDTREFNPETDTHIKKRYSIRTVVLSREENKKELQRTFSLPIDNNKPLLAFCGRLTKQKGLDLLIDVIPHIVEEKPDVQFIILGSGEERYRLELEVLQRKYPEQIGLHLRSDFRLPRRVFAGADITIIPSIYEPGGIVALEALRYGSVPLVRKTGGLNDIIVHFDTSTKKGNGFTFKNIDVWSLYGAIIEALTIYKNKTLWYKLVGNCMKSDFSWNHVAKLYEKWYRSLL